MSKRRCEQALKVTCLTELLRLRRINTSSIIASEFPLTAAGVRADIAMITNKKLIGIEIKSELDTLRRLPKQLDTLSEHFDRVILALAGRHTKKTLGELPENVEIWRITNTSISKEKPRNEKFQGASLLQLMTARERKKHLKEDCISSRALERIARKAFVAAFTERYASTSQEFWSCVETNALDDKAVSILSRYHKRRLAYDLYRKNRNLQVEKWLKAAQSDQDSSVS